MQLKSLAVQSQEGIQGSFFKRPRKESNITETYLYKDETGALASLYTVEFENGEGDLRTTHVCHHRNLCIESRPRGSHQVKYWLASDVNVTEMKDQPAEKAIRYCFFQIHKKEDHFGFIDLAKLDKEKTTVQWVNGTTYAFYKDESGNHPAAWSRVWTAFLVAAIRAWPVFERAGISTDRWFDHYQVNQKFECHHTACVRLIAFRSVVIRAYIISCSSRRSI